MLIHENIDCVIIQGDNDIMTTAGTKVHSYCLCLSVLMILQALFICLKEQSIFGRFLMQFSCHIIAMTGLFSV